MYDHVIFVSLDTLRSDCIGANPLPRLWPGKHNLDFQLKTESLDALVGGGTFFPNCIAAAPYTSTAHASIFTGKWPLRHGVYEFFNRKLRSQTVFTRAKKMGLSTIFKVDFPIILGEFLGFTENIDRYIIEDDDAFLTALSETKRSLSFVHFGGLHSPYGFHNLHYGGQAYVDKLRQLESEVGTESGYQPDELVETYRDPEDLAMLLRYKRAVQCLYSRQDYARLFLLYLEGVNFFIEHRFAPFLDRLLDQLRGKRFLLVVFGDHGEEYDADSYGHFNTLSEGVIRVPVLFYGADVPAKIHTDRIRSIDIAPTVLDLLGDTSRQRLQQDGHSLVATVRTGGSYPIRSAVAQAYTGEASEFVDFQRRTLQTGKKTGRLRHVLYKEVAYHDDCKLLRQHYEYGQGGGYWGLEKLDQARLTLEKMDGDYLWYPHASVAVERELAEQLDAYNQMRRVVGKPAPVTDDLRKQLQDMGYRI